MRSAASSLNPRHLHRFFLFPHQKTFQTSLFTQRYHRHSFVSYQNFSSSRKKMGVEQSTSNLAMSECRIVVVGPRNGEECLVELARLPKEARIIATGSTVEELRQDGNLFTEGNVMLVVNGNASTLPAIINEMPFLTWIHSTYAGVDHVLCPEIVDNPDIILTNAKGVFSGSLAEYAMLSCLHFAKDLPRMIQSKSEKKWDKFKVTELRGTTMGIIGYGDIGRACARLAKSFNMKTIGLRRNPDLSEHDRLVDEIVGNDKLDYVIENSDYLVVCLALTKDTKHFIKEENLKKAKKNMVLVNIGRGALIDEDALIRCLENGTIAGAALDVFTVEPLPETSKIWDLPNVIVSAHNADYTNDSRKSSVRFFTELCPRFLKGEEFEGCVVDKTSGY